MTGFEHPAFELLARGQLEQAAAEAKQGLAERPDDPRLLACLAEATAATNPTEARAMVERASSSRPGDAALLLAAARVQWRTGDHRAATSTARQVTTVAPNWAEGQAASAVITLDHSRRGLRTSPEPDLYRRAKRASASAVESAPDWPMAHIVDGQVELAEGNHDRAAEAAKTALRLDPHNPQALVLLADATLARGDETQARRLYGQAGPWPPAVQRLQPSTVSNEWLRPNPMMAVMLGAMLLGAVIRISGQPVIGLVFTLLGFVAAGLVVVSAIRRSRQRRVTAREELTLLLTPGSPLVGAAGGRSDRDPNG